MHTIGLACDAADCEKCEIADSCPECLTLKAHVCMRLTELPAARPVRAELEQFSLDLMEEARRLREQQCLVPGDSARSCFRPEA